MYELLVDYFQIPEIAHDYIPLFLRSEEIAAIEKMGRALYCPEKLRDLLSDITGDPMGLVSEAYSRSVFNKAEDGDDACFQAAVFYDRLAYFAQYEPELWKSIPKERRALMDTWYVEKYASGARGRLEEALRDNSRLIENAFFFTLDETLKIIDDLDGDPYMVPCNCKSVAMNCDKPRDVCILFKKGINSQWDRGHGKPLTREEAKDIIRFANKSGLMQTSEMESAICNCDGCCCYPIRASRLIGAKGLWPKKVYDVVWDEKSCVGCGKCAKLCNFGAFRQDGLNITFDPEACWSCTICSGNCPVGAISLERI
ncbi:hypothetical protein AGMMS50276_27580 [Synergistales bacterium]|nr:hypothetical protein AGMMS50276_27580 [Synergistales bacterium]